MAIKIITMATIKSYTDISQSKKLAEFLPLESADMHYNVVGDAIIGDYQNGISSARSVAKAWKKNPDEFAKNVIPCWSLAALLEFLPKIVNTETLFIETSATLWHVGYRNVHTAIETYLIDACYELIIKLHELDLV